MRCKNCAWNNPAGTVKCEKCNCFLCCLDTSDSPAISFNANDLYKEVDIILQLDVAPDNVKRLIETHRKKHAFDFKYQVAHSIGCDEQQIPSQIIDKIKEIDNLCNTELLKKNIVNFNTKDNLLAGDFYLFDKPINFMIPGTLLTQILGGGSKLDLLYKYRGNGTNKAPNTAACAAFGDEAFQKARDEVESKKYLAISLHDNSAKVVCLSNRKNHTAFGSVEKFHSEDISIYNPTIVSRELLYDFNASLYIEYLTEVAQHKRTIFFEISRQNIAVALATMFANLSELHESGFVHCDLKPQNILSLKEGLMPIDSLNVRKGEISAGMTPDFCAPEQVLTLPVSPATDIYNLGLIILSIIDGIVYGKTSNYLIPTGGTQAKNVKLLTEPMIYIDYNSANIQNKEGIPFWRSFLEKCLAFEQRNRFTNMNSFINEYNRLIELYPLKNAIKFIPNFGKLSLAPTNNNEQEPVWIVN